jgi:hypothetical protein
MIDRSNWIRYHATNIEYALDVSVSPNADLDGTVYMAYCHDEDEYLTIDAYEFEWEVAQ